MADQSSKLLINEPALQVLPSLAVVLGLNEAVVLQQVQYWLNNPKSGEEHDGRKWIYNSYTEWQEQFPFWSLNTIRRAIDSLETRGVLLTSDKYNEKPEDRTRWYSIDYDKLNSLPLPSPKRKSNKRTQSPKMGTPHQSPNLEKPIAQNGHTQSPKMGSSLKTETSSETPSETQKKNQIPIAVANASAISDPLATEFDERPLPPKQATLIDKAKEAQAIKRLNDEPPKPERKPDSATLFKDALEDPPKESSAKEKVPAHWQVYNSETGEISGTFDDRALAVTENRDLNKLGGARFKLRKVEPEKPGKQPPQYGEVVVALVEAYWKLPIADVKRATMQRAGDVAKALLADFPDATADEVRRSAKAFEDMSRNASLPLGTRTMVDWFARWRAQHKPKSGNEYLNDAYFKRRGETA